MYLIKINQYKRISNKIITSCLCLWYDCLLYCGKYTQTHFLAETVLRLEFFSATGTWGMYLIVFCSDIIDQLFFLRRILHGLTILGRKSDNSNIWTWFSTSQWDFTVRYIDSLYYQINKVELSYVEQLEITMIYCIYVLHVTFTSWNSSHWHDLLSIEKFSIFNCPY